MTRLDAAWTGTSLRRAVSLGLLAGLGEAAIRLGWRYLGGRMQIHTGLDILWMAPLADAAVFLVVALGLVATLAILGRRLTPATKLAFVTGALVALAVWSLTERVPQIGSRAGALLGLGTGVAVAQALRRRGMARTVLDHTLLPLGAAVGILGVAVIAGGIIRERRSLATLPAHDRSLPNVLLLILDTVRAQSSSVNGYVRRTTPEIEALADSGVRFERAFATARGRFRLTHRCSPAAIRTS